MALGINTNIASLIAQRNLTTSADKLSIAVQRLSSGLRINSAKDDAAGLGISERMTSQIRGLDQAARNANDGVSLAQTAEGALGEITNNLQRIRELAVQAANSTNSSSDRAALDAEVQQRIAEINRTATTASFNNQKILDGLFGTATFQVGANVNETISIGLNTSMKTSDIGSYVNVSSDVAAAAFGNAATTVSGAFGSGAYQTGASYSSGTYSGVDQNSFSAGGVQINGVSINASANYAHATDTRRGSDSAYAKTAAINASGISGLTASATTTKTFDDNTVADNMFMDVAALNGTDTMAYTLTVNGTSIYSAVSVNTTGITMDDAVEAINSRQNDTGVVASKNSSNQLVLTAADGRNIAISETFAFTDGVGGDSDGVVESVFSTQTVTDDTTDSDDSGSVSQSLTVRGSITLQSSSSITINTGGAYIGFAAGSYAASSSLEAQDVLTVSGANDTINSVDSALAAVSNLRGTFGSIQNRFGSVVASLMATSENLSAARSRILDADFAAETASLTKASIAQQAGVAMLAQANALPQQVLSLLRG